MTALTAPTVEQVAPGVVTRVRPGELVGTQKGLLGVSAVALIASIVPAFLGEDDHARHRVMFSYLTAYMFTLSVALGALFFVMIQHITRAGWSVVVRRIAENMAGTLFPWMAILFAPIAIWYHDLWHHWIDAQITDPSAADYDSVIAGKSGYLNVPFFFVRAVLYFVIWAGLSRYFRGASLAQDQDGDPQRSLKMARMAAPGLLLFGVTTTFAAFDWIMSLDPHWFSTMFGVIYFAGGVLGVMATIGLTALFLAKKGYLGDVINTEHYHDIGKLMFAFMVFWAYTSFSQFMLIWYANLPEETIWFAHRSEGAWSTMFVVLCVGHFLVPFAFLMSRHLKRNTKTLAFAAVFMLVMHWCDMAYQILPNVDHHGFHLTWTDISAVVGVFGLFVAMALKNIIATPLIPERDPRLAESLHFHNV
jgi:hypothetical protein